MQIKFMGNKEEISCHIIKENLQFVKKISKIQSKNKEGAALKLLLDPVQCSFFKS